MRFFTLATRTALAVLVIGMFAGQARAQVATMGGGYSSIGAGNMSVGGNISSMSPSANMGWQYTPFAGGFNVPASHLGNRQYTGMVNGAPTAIPSINVPGYGGYGGPAFRGLPMYGGASVPAWAWGIGGQNRAIGAPIYRAAPRTFYGGVYQNYGGNYQNGAYGQYGNGTSGNPGYGTVYPRGY